jgi:hypothetical protein
MKEIDEKNLDITLKIFNKLPSQQIKPVKFEDIPREIERILSKVLKNKNIKINGNGLTEPINAEIKDEKKVEN